MVAHGQCLAYGQDIQILAADMALLPELLGLALGGLRDALARGDDQQRGAGGLREDGLQRAVRRVERAGVRECWSRVHGPDRA